MRAHWGSEQQEELRIQVTYHMYLASLGQLSYTPSVELVVGWTICETFLNFLAICQLCHAHVRRDTRLSPLSHTVNDKKLDRACGNKATQLLHWHWSSCLIFDLSTGDDIKWGFEQQCWWSALHYLAPPPGPRGYWFHQHLPIDHCVLQPDPWTTGDSQHWGMLQDIWATAPKCGEVSMGRDRSNVQACVDTLTKRMRAVLHTTFPEPKGGWI